MHHLCTYFDKNYLARGLALYRSLHRHAKPFRLYVLCFDDFTYEYLRRLNDPSLVPIDQASFEAADPPLAATRSQRTRIEYYFTCTPALPLYVMNRFPGVEVVTYIDADLYFYRDPQPIYEEMGNGSVLIVEHRFPPYVPHLSLLLQHGIYNVGLLAFRNDARGRGCLEWWRERCIEWCHDRLEDGKYGDQRYLDDWPQRFAGVVVLQHKGAGLAPWNLAQYQVDLQGGVTRVDGVPLIFYHFHDLKVLGRRLFEARLSDWGARFSRPVRSGIYGPYVKELGCILADLGEGAQDNTRYAGQHGGGQIVRKVLFSSVLVSAGPAVIALRLEVLELQRAWKLLLRLRNGLMRRLRSRPDTERAA